jgi:integrase/recombinase XerD
VDSNILVEEKRGIYKFRVSLKHLEYDNANYIEISFPFTHELKEKVKQINGVRWSPSMKCWHIINTPKNLSLIVDHLKDIAWLDLSELKEKSLPLKPEKSFEEKSNVSRELKSKLSRDHLPYVVKYREFLQSKRLSESTVNTYVSMVSSFLGHYHMKRIDDIFVNDIHAYNYEVIIKNDFSISYQRQFVSALKQFAVYHVLDNFEPEKLDRPKKSHTLPTVLSKEEIVAILKATHNLKHQAIISTIYAAGLRIQELLNLKIRDINLERGQIHIIQAKGRKDRYIGLSKLLAMVLTNYFDVYHPKYFLFEGQEGGPYSATSIRMVLKRACERCGIFKKVTPHTLRHSYATHMLESGVDLRYVQELLGHSRPETTMIYTHVTRKTLLSIDSPFDNLSDISGLKTLQGHNKDDL